MNYTMSSYVPTIFVESLGCTPLQTAAYLVSLSAMFLGFNMHFISLAAFHSSSFCAM